MVRRMQLLALFVALMVPCAAPFAATASITSASTSSSSSKKPLTNPQPPAASTFSNNQNSLYKTQHLARHMATADLATATTSGDDNGTKKRYSSLKRFMNIVRGKESDRGRKDRWRGGEYAATLPSRLLFQYATPLLNEASKRRLEPDDAFEIPEHRRMGTAVSTLTTIFEDMRENSKRKLEEDRAVGLKKLKTSQSILLTKALLVHQRKMLIWTGFLRLFNTLIQAFPSLLLARLLRYIEAGDAYPPSKAFMAAAHLVAVLLGKLIVENQFFHHVVKCSTEVRGALSGLIFDKSLRLPGGGSAVTHKADSKKKGYALGAGGVVNLMQSDASIIENAAMQIHTIWDAPLQVRKRRMACLRRIERMQLRNIFLTLFLFLQIDVRLLSIHHFCFVFWDPLCCMELRFSC